MKKKQRNGTVEGGEPQEIDERKKNSNGRVRAVPQRKQGEGRKKGGYAWWGASLANNAVVNETGTMTGLRRGQAQFSYYHSTNFELPRTTGGEY